MGVGPIGEGGALVNLDKAALLEDVFHFSQ